MKGQVLVARSPEKSKREPGLFKRVQLKHWGNVTHLPVDKQKQATQSCSVVVIFYFIYLFIFLF